MRIAVMGSGGLGGYFGARLCQDGSDVHFVARGSQFDVQRAFLCGHTSDHGHHGTSVALDANRSDRRSQ